eukprot:9491175-Pyramimonas_sp.AAC.1
MRTLRTNTKIRQILLCRLGKVLALRANVAVLDCLHGVRAGRHSAEKLLKERFTVVVHVSSWRGGARWRGGWPGWRQR